MEVRFCLLQKESNHFIEDFRGGYRFGGNPEEIFEKFFGSKNPFAHVLGKHFENLTLFEICIFNSIKLNKLQRILFE